MLHASASTISADPQAYSSPELIDAGNVEAPGLDEVLAEVQAAIAPLWPLKDYVAVNPFVGFTDRSFLAARETLRELRDSDILMPLNYYRKLVHEGEVLTNDLELALHQCRCEYPAWYSQGNVERLLARLERGTDEELTTDRRYWTVAESLDRFQGTDWTSAIVDEISRHCAAHYDEGQAIWSSPWKHLPLYAAWRTTSLLDRRFEKLGVRHFRSFVSKLPASPHEAIAYLLTWLEVPEVHWRSFLLCQLFSVSGWASYVKYRVREATMVGNQNDDLIGLLAIRLAYDSGLVSGGLAADLSKLYPSVAEKTEGLEQDEIQPNQSTLDRYLLQVAAEIAYRRRLVNVLVNPERKVVPATQHKKVQMVFCIDVRSELIRRHLESVTNEIETFGFAGFFGLALEYLPLGSSTGPSQCPVLLKPVFQIPENLRGADDQSQAAVSDKRRSVRRLRQVVKSFQTSAASCFSFVESIGLLYLVKLVADAFQWSRPADSGQFDGVPARGRNRLGPILQKCGDHGLTLHQKIDLAEGMLRNLGLTRGFARTLVICGHASETVNNPYRAGLDCGACGGHSGEVNARVAADLLNDAAVRAGLQSRGIDIPQDVWAVAAVHNTTTDEIRFFDAETMPDSHAADFRELQQWAARASQMSRAERAIRLGSSSPQEVFERSREWSEVRPEWGLAGNAAFVVAPRARTSGLKLDGRTFMHSYDFRLDPEGKVLELIMTAPMVVTNWINMQYYASTVDNRAYGSGNKVIHNVVGQLGILQGNSGDLMTGLPQQSVHDGQEYQHEPLRLVVVIEAPRATIERILHKHSAVQDLVGNGWLSLMAIEDEQIYQYFSLAGWEPWHARRT